MFFVSWKLIERKSPDSNYSGAYLLIIKPEQLLKTEAI